MNIIITVVGIIIRMTVATIISNHNNIGNRKISIFVIVVTWANSNKHCRTIVMIEIVINIVVEIVQMIKILWVVSMLENMLIIIGI